MPHLFHRATILHLAERVDFKRVHESFDSGELHICGMPLKTISFLDLAANAVFTSLEVEFRAQAHVLLSTGYDSTKNCIRCLKAGGIVKLPDKELRTAILVAGGGYNNEEKR